MSTQHGDDVERLARMLAGAEQTERAAAAVLALALLAERVDLGPAGRPDLGRPAGDVADPDGVTAIAVLLATLPADDRRAAHRLACQHLLDRLGHLEGLRLALAALSDLTAAASQVPTAAERDWLGEHGISG